MRVFGEIFPFFWEEIFGFLSWNFSFFLRRDFGVFWGEFLPFLGDVLRGFFGGFWGKIWGSLGGTFGVLFGVDF